MIVFHIRVYVKRFIKKTKIRSLINSQLFNQLKYLFIKDLFHYPMENLLVVLPYININYLNNISLNLIKYIPSILLSIKIKPFYFMFLYIFIYFIDFFFIFILVLRKILYRRIILFSQSCYFFICIFLNAIRPFLIFFLQFQNHFSSFFLLNQSNSFNFFSIILYQIVKVIIYHFHDKKLNLLDYLFYW